MEGAKPAPALRLLAIGADDGALSALHPLEPQLKVARVKRDAMALVVGSEEPKLLLPQEREAAPERLGQGRKA